MAAPRRRVRDCDGYRRMTEQRNRVVLDSIDLPERSNDLFDAIVERSSVRSFRPEAVPKERVRKAIEAAGWAPSPHGTQPWRFVVLESFSERSRLADAMASTWRSQLLVDGQSADMTEIRLQRSKERLSWAPFVVILCLFLGDAHSYPDAKREEAETLMAVQSLGAAAQNFLLALHAQGLDSGWMCGPLFCPDVVRETLSLDANLVPHAMFPIGCAAAAPKRRPRRPVAELIDSWK